MCSDIVLCFCALCLRTSGCELRLIMFVFAVVLELPLRVFNGRARSKGVCCSLSLSFSLSLTVYLIVVFEQGVPPPAKCKSAASRDKAFATLSERMPALACNCCSSGRSSCWYCPFSHTSSSCRGLVVVSRGCFWCDGQLGSVCCLLFQCCVVVPRTCSLPFAIA